MPILVECSACDGKFRVDDMHAGKRIRCPGCQGVITVPAAQQQATRTQDRSRPSASAPQTRASSASRPPSVGSSDSSSSDVRRGRSGTFQTPRVRQPHDPDRYTQASVAPWKIVTISAGAVITLGIVGVLLFTSMLGPGSESDISLSVADAGSKSSASSGDANSAHAPPVEVPSATTADVPVKRDPAMQDSETVVASTFSNGIQNNASSVPATTDQLPAATGRTGIFGNSVTPGEALAETPSTNPTPSLPSATPATNADSTPVAPSNPATASGATVLAVSETDLSIDELFSRVEGSVVRVNVSSNEGAGNGSGFVIDSAGIVVTNYHVIAGANKAWVEFANKEKIDVDGFLFIDHMKDIAILKFDAARCVKPILSIPVAQVHPRKGIAVVAIGAPLGLDMSVTEGIVSAVRTAKELEESIDLTGHSGTWVQTTAAISPGNSGGPLITKRGEVVAINTLTLVGAGAQSLNFGISGEDIRQAMTELEDAPIPLSPLSAPEMRRDHPSGEASGSNGILDASGTPQGEKLLAELRKLEIVFLPLTFNDPGQTVISAVRSEARQTLEKSGIEESLISNEKAALLLLMNLERAGNRLVLYVTAHIIVQDGSSGRPQIVKIWERTGEVGSISQQAILSGNLPTNLRKEIREFFAKLRGDILKAKKATSEPTK